MNKLNAIFKKNPTQNHINVSNNFFNNDIIYVSGQYL